MCSVYFEQEEHLQSVLLQSQLEPEQLPVAILVNALPKNVALPPGKVAMLGRIAETAARIRQGSNVGRKRTSSSTVAAHFEDDV